MKELLSTKDVADFLKINEKVVYTLISEKRLPALKVTGKWLFPRHLVEQWIENNTLNYPEVNVSVSHFQYVTVLIGSNDPLLDSTLSLFNRTYPGHTAVFGNVGSMGGLQALRHNQCHIATCHLLEDNREEYNFDFANKEMDRLPAIVNFCRREQGFLIAKGNPKHISTIKDLTKKGIRIVNRPLGTGTRLLFDKLLNDEKIDPESIEGYDFEIAKHIDVGIEILRGNVDAGPSIRYVATLLGLDFIPSRWERYDLLIRKERFFDRGVQLFLGLLHEKSFLDMASRFEGYDIQLCGKVMYSQEKSTQS